jgi:hypothetical protein
MLQREDTAQKLSSSPVKEGTSEAKEINLF